MAVARIRESYFQRLLHEMDPPGAVFELSRMWELRADISGSWFGLSEAEHHVTMALIYVGEVGNGGHEQFFANHGGQVVMRVRTTLDALGLTDLEAVLRGALAAFPGGVVPEDRAVVEHQLAELEPVRHLGAPC